MDWKDAGLRDPTGDLADLICHPNQDDLLSMEEWRLVLDPCLASWASPDRRCRPDPERHCRGTAHTRGDVHALFVLRGYRV